MRTLIVSDLHLGSKSRSDVLRLAHVRAALIDALRDVDRLVLLGDVIELRHGPRASALRAAGPVLQELGAAMAGKQIVLLAGNHDHALIEGWLEHRAETDEQTPLGPQQLLAPNDASPLARTLAQWLAPAEVSIAYPGFWVREDVYAIHGNYLDCHMTVPTIERLAIATMSKVLGRPASEFASVEDYEAVIGPVYAWIDAVAAAGSGGSAGSALNGKTTMRMWRVLDSEGASAGSARAGTAATAAAAKLATPGSATNGSPARAWAVGARRRLARQAVRRGFPLAVAALNRAGIGPVKPNVSGPELRRAALLAMGEVAERLDLRAEHLVFGHTHRTGPLPGDSESEWRPSGGMRLFNCGSWVHTPGFVTSDPGGGPYWPGSCVVVEDGVPPAPPEVRRLLASFSQADLVAS
ncbi:MAG TPA: metallophosphoesterase [Solirubrobacteraceae bacterium]|jgi:predicted phosphodiesterase